MCVCVFLCVSSSLRQTVVGEVTEGCFGVANYTFTVINNKYFSSSNFSLSIILCLRFVLFSICFLFFLLREV